MLTDITKRLLVEEYTRRVQHFTLEELKSDINMIPDCVRIMNKIYQNKHTNTNIKNLFNLLHGISNVFGSTGIVALIEYISEDHTHLEHILSTVLEYYNGNNQSDIFLPGFLSTVATK